MTGRPAPTVYLQIGGNPWSGTLDDAVVEQIILDAALKGEEQIQRWITAGQAEQDAVFAQVILDPTNPRDGDYSIHGRLLAIVFYGEEMDANLCLPNAAAKADATDRHGGHWTNGELVAEANFCLGNDDFAWGDTAMFHGAISAGSGLSVKQDKKLAGLVLELVMTEVHKRRAAWLDAQREECGTQSWFNRDNAAGTEYRIDLDTRYWKKVPSPTS